MERLTTLLKETGGIEVPSPHLFIASIGKRATQEGLAMAERFRTEGLWVEVGYEGSLRSQLRRADKIASHYVFIIGDDELSSGKMQWKNLRDGSQGEVEMTQVDEFVSSHLLS